MKLSRLFSIVYLLLDKNTMTAKELADYFEVSTRTILRDINSLSVAGIPVFTSRGKSGGISILDTFRLDKTILTTNEQALILLGLQGLSATNSKDVATLLPKLKALFNRPDTDWIEVDFSRWGHQRADNKKFETLKQAILAQRAITCHYASSYGELSNRIILPLKLMFKSKSWYLLGIDTNTHKNKMYKLTRMSKEIIIGDSFKLDSSLSTKNSTLQHMQPQELITVTMQFSPEVVYRAYDEFDADAITKNPDGSFTVTATVPHDEWIYGFLLSLGASVRVIRPISVQQKMLSKAKEMHSFYNDLQQ